MCDASAGSGCLNTALPASQCQMVLILTDCDMSGLRIQPEMDVVCAWTIVSCRCMIIIIIDYHYDSPILPACSLPPSGQSARRLLKPSIVTGAHPAVLVLNLPHVLFSSSTHASKLHMERTRKPSVSRSTSKTSHQPCCVPDPVLSEFDVLLMSQGSETPCSCAAR